MTEEKVTKAKKQNSGAKVLNEARERSNVVIIVIDKHALYALYYIIISMRKESDFEKKGTCLSKRDCCFGSLLSMHYSLLKRMYIKKDNIKKRERTGRSTSSMRKGGWGWSQKVHRGVGSSADFIFSFVYFFIISSWYYSHFPPSEGLASSETTVSILFTYIVTPQCATCIYCPRT